MRGFGELEAVVMDRIWSLESAATVREVLDDLGNERPLAYTTVMTVMENLRRKGFLVRALDGRAYRYRPAKARSEYAAELMGEALANSGDRTGALLGLVQHMTPTDVASLRTALEAASRERRMRR